MNINDELANILLSTRFFNESTLQTGKGEADVIIEDKKGNTWYFEIKQSNWPNGKFFDAATLTQWYTWYTNQERYYFVFITGKYKNKRQFTFVRASELMEHSTIPPFKIYFNIYKDEMEDSFVDGKTFKQQVRELAENNNIESLPFMRKHVYKHAASQNNDEEAIQLTSVSIEDLKQMFDSLKNKE